LLGRYANECNWPKVMCGDGCRKFVCHRDTPP
jgi:hypothetical protein